MKKTIILLHVLSLLALAGCGREAAEILQPADRVYLNGVVYTADSENRIASAIAVSGKRIVYVGDDAGARDRIGDDSVVVDLDGQMILPGLHDMHIHPIGIIDRGGCDLQSEPMNLAEIAVRVSRCIAERELPPGEWLPVDQWNFAEGNRPADGLTTLREALDRAAPENPVILWGNDGHHGAVNSAALALATDPEGRVVGISAETIRLHFGDYRATIGVDAAGRPNGELHETARLLVNPPPWRGIDGLTPDAVPKIAAKLAENGLTAVQDAALAPGLVGVYRSLVDAGGMTFRLSVAVHQDVPSYTDARGVIDVDSMLADLQALREEYREVPYIQVETAKIFVDGVIEGNPLSVPPTLPNAAVLQPYKQPRFSVDEAAHELGIAGYVDTDSEICRRVRMTPEMLDDSEAVEGFQREMGFHPAQCRISRGVLEHPPAFVRDYVRALDAAGFNIHAHVIGDRAVRTALDALDFARQENGPAGGTHSLGHIQLVAPEDYARIAEHKLYLVFTYAWILPDYYYDLTVLPFIDEVDGVDDLYDPGHYYMRNNYPAAQLQSLGAVLAAGSDAPVDTREPRPFVNIEQAVTRANEEGKVLNPAGRVSLNDALRAYTIHGARLFGHDAETGSLEVGKLADLVVIDQDLLALEAAGRAADISDTRVLETLFEGRVVYEAP